jgi:response regulator RpfG family c-di-GMP phosphodiesterase
MYIVSISKGATKLNTKVNILVVDDDPMIVQLISMILTKSEYNISGVTSGAEALVLLKDQPIDIMLVDYSMPEMDGAALINKSRKVHPNLIIFVITAYPTSYLRAYATLEGVQAVIPKPLEYSSFLTKVKTALDNRNTLSASEY